MARLVYEQFLEPKLGDHWTIYAPGVGLINLGRGVQRGILMGILGFLSYWAVLILAMQFSGFDWWLPKPYQVAAAGLTAGIVAGLISSPRPRAGVIVGLVGGLSAVLAWYVFVGFMIGVSGNPQPVPLIVRTSSIWLFVLSSVGGALGALAGGTARRRRAAAQR